MNIALTNNLYSNKQNLISSYTQRRRRITMTDPPMNDESNYMGFPRIYITVNVDSFTCTCSQAP